MMEVERINQIQNLTDDLTRRLTELRGVSLTSIAKRAVSKKSTARLRTRISGTIPNMLRK